MEVFEASEVYGVTLLASRIIVQQDFPKKAVSSFWKVSRKRLFAIRKLRAKTHSLVPVLGNILRDFFEKPSIRGIDGERETLNDRQLLL